MMLPTDVHDKRLPQIHRKMFTAQFLRRLAAGGSLAAFAIGASKFGVLSASDSGPADLYSKVYTDIAASLDCDGYDDGSYGPVFVRLAWHSAGTYSKVDKTGGSNGSGMRFKPEASNGANAGLQVARDRLAAIKAKHPEITFADLWTLAGVAAIQEMGRASWAAPPSGGAPVARIMLTKSPALPMTAYLLQTRLTWATQSAKFSRRPQRESRPNFTQETQEENPMENPLTGNLNSHCHSEFLPCRLAQVKYKTRLPYEYNMFIGVLP